MGERRECRSESSRERVKGDGCVPWRRSLRVTDQGPREAEREIVKERAREIYRKWYSIAAGKDAESGPQLYGGRRCASPFLATATGAAITYILSRFRNNNYFIPEVNDKTRGPKNAGERKKARKRERERGNRFSFGPIS